MAYSIEQGLGRQRSLLINLIGRTSLKTLGAVLERCECLITGDTWPMHLAAAVGTPVLAIFFGTAYPWETGPYGPGHFVLYSDVPCAPCLDPNQCQEGHRCKKELTPSVVMKAFEAAEGFWKNEPVRWEAGRNSTRLFVTTKEKESEQILVPLDDKVNLSKQSAQGICREWHMGRSGPDVLLIKGDEVISLFLTGEAENGFLSFAQYLDYLLEAKDVVLEGRHEAQQIFSRLLEECLLAMQSKDVVTLMDAIEYGFKPLIGSSFGRESD